MDVSRVNLNVEDSKMETNLENLCLRFRKKGFLPIEIPELIKDALRLVDNNRYATITEIDQELEDLGWGIGVMDFATFELITALAENSTLQTSKDIFLTGSYFALRMKNRMGLSERSLKGDAS